MDSIPVSNKTKIKKSLLTRRHKRLAKTQNKGINRAAVLSSGRRLPSNFGFLRLESLVSIAHDHLKEMQHKYLERTKLLEQRLLLSKRYRNDPELLKEIPNHYLLDQRLRVINEALGVAAALYDDLQAVYKRSTGHEWKPKLDINEPI
jgi:hypothetical protein